MDRYLPTDGLPENWISAYYHSTKDDDFRLTPEIYTTLRNEGKKGWPRTQTQSQIDTLAKQYGIISGKWLLYPTATAVDSAWLSLIRATLEVKLGTSIKVGTVPIRDNTYLICVYTANYLNKEDVMRVRANLVDFGFTKILYYKSDIKTCLGIDSREHPDLIRASDYAK